MDKLKILGFDIGISSIGWAYVEGGELKDCGVRIFTKAENPKDGSSLALPRREARGSRRRLARRKARLNELKRLITAEFGLNLEDFLANAGELPKAYTTSKATKSPYQLRADALECKLSADEFARVILHIAKHRGYGNKHAKDLNDDESGKVKKAIRQNADIMSQKGYKSVGEYLYKEFYQQKRDLSEKSSKNAFATQEFQNVRNKKDNYARCVAQIELKRELELIFKTQKSLGWKFSEKKYQIFDENRKIKEADFESAVMEVAFLQRPLKSFAGKVGKCTFFENEPRAPKDSLSAMEFVALTRIINTLANISKKTGEIYSTDKVSEVLEAVLEKGELTYKNLRKILNLPKDIYFPKDKNLDYTKGNISTQIKSLLYKISKKASPKPKEYIYTKDQEMQIYDIVRENGGISYLKLREILNLDKNIKFDNTLLGRGKGLDYTKANVEIAIREIKEKDPESSAFINFENLVKFKNAFESKKKDTKTGKTIDDNEGLEENDRMKVGSEIFANLVKNHKDELDKIAQDIANEKDRVRLRQKLESYAILKGKDEWLDSLSGLNFSKHINLSFKALSKILPYMRKGMLYNEAVKSAQKETQNPLPNPKDKEKYNLLPTLKDYEPYLANPVVARALSEYRKVCNALLKKYGNDCKVHKIHIELGREVGKSYLTRQQYEKEQKENLRKINEAKELLTQYHLPINDTNILKARLFKEQNECCVYSKAKIKEEHLRDDKALEIDHIYPYSRSFDDSYMNKVLVFTKENQNKRNQTPFEAFGKEKEKWEMIKSFAKNFLPHQKYKRIVNENFADKQNEFKDRNLNDTRYMARLALNYTKDNLEFEKLSEDECIISGEKNSKVHCEAVSGTLTTNLRRIWGFEDKNRDNHLHHALDAIIIAHINASMIQRFSEYYKRKNELKINHYKKRDKLKWQLYNQEISQDEYNKQDAINSSEYTNKKEELKERIKQKFCLPYGDFHKIVEEKKAQIFVSKPPRKRARGALHKETFSSINDSALLKTYGGQEGVKMAINLGKIRQIGSKVADNGSMVRTDIFRHKSSGKFYGVPIYTMDYALGKLPNKAVVSGKDKVGVIKDWLEMDEKYEFCFSLFKDDLLFVQKKEMSRAELCYFTEFKSSTAGINFEKHDSFYVDLSENQRKLFTAKQPVKGGKKEWKDKTPEEIERLEKARKIIGGFATIEDLEIFEKWQVSPLGEVKKAEFKEREPISLKSSPKDSKGKRLKNEL